MRTKEEVQSMLKRVNRTLGLYKNLRLEEKNHKLQQQLDQLKAENEELKKQLKNLQNKQIVKMITLEIFEKIIKDIQKHDKENEILSDILIGNENYGWVSHGNIIVNDLIKLMQRIFKDDNDDINWWLYDSEAGKFVWWHDYKYDLTEIKDLYYWLKKDYDKVKKEKEE